MMNDGDDDFDKNGHPNRIFNQIILIIYTHLVVVVSCWFAVLANKLHKQKKIVHFGSIIGFCI